MAKAKARRKPRRTKVEMAEERARIDRFTYDRGHRDGSAEAEKKAREDTRAKLLDANIKLAQQLGQMIEATARAVTTFIGEGGVRG